MGLIGRPSEPEAGDQVLRELPEPTREELNLCRFLIGAMTTARAKWTSGTILTNEVLDVCDEGARRLDFALRLIRVLAAQVEGQLAQVRDSNKIAAGVRKAHRETRQDVDRLAAAAERACNANTPATWAQLAAVLVDVRAPRAERARRATS